ncbi:MAG: PIN domain nuclease [Armatimonadetes bacterium]|nr:PIN domain nuclease [Armatimonadota bacterium]
MLYLADTNIIACRINESGPLYAILREAMFILERQGGEIFITSQIMIEFRAVATRPEQANGLGISHEEAKLSADHIQPLFRLLPDVPEIYSYWCNLVDTYKIIGRQVFDARLCGHMALAVFLH